MLINHFDLLPCAQEAWMVDKNGGISHWDTRESKKESGRRRWVVQEEGRGAKLGGVSVNRESGGGFTFIVLNKLKAGACSI